MAKESNNLGVMEEAEESVIDKETMHFFTLSALKKHCVVLISCIFFFAISSKVKLGNAAINLFLLIRLIYFVSTF